MNKILTSLGLATVALAAPLAAQDGGMAPTTMFIDLRGGIALPTFDIADDLKSGADIGVSFGYLLNMGLVLMGDFDYGFNKSKGVGSLDVKTMHYMAKLGYPLMKGAAEKGWDVLINGGVGAVSFDPEGTGATHTYFGINVGAKIVYSVNRQFAVVISPQGDIAFSKKDEIGTSNAWVWPLTAGLRVRF